MKKIFLTAIMSICLIFSTSMPAFAATGGDYQIQWQNVSSISLTMSYSGGAVNWTGEINGKPNTANIDATFKLEKLNASGKYEPVGSWSASSKATYLYKAASKTTPKGTYRLSVTAKVKSASGAIETVSDSLVKTFN